MSHPVSLSCSGERHELSRQLHTLVQLLQRVPDTREPSGHAAFFDAMRAVLIDVCAAAPEPWPGADALVMLAVTQLERQPLKNDPLVFDLLQRLQAHGFLEGERRTQLKATLRRLLGQHLGLFWQACDVPVLAAVGARSQRAAAVDIHHLNLPWTLRPGQVGADHRAAANEPDAHPEMHRPSARQDGTEAVWLPAA
jgi:hypothetical protein